MNIHFAYYNQAKESIKIKPRELAHRAQNMHIRGSVTLGSLNSKANTHDQLVGKHVLQAHRDSHILSLFDC